MLEKNRIAVNGVVAEAISASDTSLSFFIPKLSTYSKAELIVSSPGLLADTILIIVSENPLAEITAMIPQEGPPGTIIKMIGKNFNPNEELYLILYEDALNGFFIPLTESGQYLSTLLTASSDSIIIEVPTGFRQGRIHIFTETNGQPNTRYTLFSPKFKTIY
ncbi:MAG: hypothetical protein HC819_04685 [Cyclobacteriaceae bacterium]|nr:hypothetical protein [Cyclobacteriaceae bacterium]